MASSRSTGDARAGIATLDRSFHDRRRAIATFTLCLLFAACGGEPPERPAQLPAVDSGSRTPAESTKVTGSKEPADTVQPGPTLLTPDGWGPLRIGMTRAEVVEAAGEDARPDAPGGAEPEICDEFRPRNAPEGVLVMIERGILTRISLSRNRNIATPEGIRIGDSGSEVVTKYGTRARIDPHKYSIPPARYVTVWRKRSEGRERRGIRYEINRTDEVVRIYAGGPSIEYVEGCL